MLRIAVKQPDPATNLTCRLCQKPDLLRRLGGNAVYPPWESLASASPRPNFPSEDKLHNLRVDVVDPMNSSNTVFHLHLNNVQYSCMWL